MATTRYGGHIAHIELSSFTAESYIDKVCLTFLQSVEEFLRASKKVQ